MKMAYNITVDEMPPVTVSQLELYVVVVLLSIISVVGVSGNALVLFVFSSKRDGLVSTFFITVLAVIDLTTCAFIVPFTIVMELKEFQVSTDFVCKLYQFLITSNVPFSSLVMAAIAVDRYLCICRPFWRVLTVTRAKWIVCLLALLVSCLGLIGSLTHGVYQYRTGTSVTAPIIEANLTSTHGQLRTADVYTTGYESDLEEMNWVNTEACEPTEAHISFQTGFAFQKCYNGVFFSCLLIVSVLYSLIYKSVRQRQLWRDQQKTKTGSSTTAASASAHHQHQNSCQQPKTTRCYLKQASTVVTQTERLSTADGQRVCLLTTNPVMLQADSDRALLTVVQSSAKHCHAEPPQVSIQPAETSNVTPATAGPVTLNIPTDNCCHSSTEAVDETVDDTEHTRLMSDAARSPTDGSKVLAGLNLFADSSVSRFMESSSHSSEVSDDKIRKSPAALKDTVELSEAGVTQLVDASAVAVMTGGANTKQNGATLTSQKNRIANIRMAAMLFVVTLVFVTTFMPALAMTMRLMPYNAIVFYMYFSYSIANPIIYSFMNQNFRKQLSRIFGKRQH